MPLNKETKPNQTNQVRTATTVFDMPNALHRQTPLNIKHSIPPENDTSK